MAPRSTADPGFQSTVARWISANGEVFVVVRYPNHGGAKSYEFFASTEAFLDRIAGLAQSTSVVVLAERQLPFRGRVDNEFIADVLQSIPDGSDWLIVCQELMHIGAASWYHDCTGDSHAELESELRDDYCFGKPVAVGLEPPWWHGDSETIVSAFAPNPDGSITVAAY